jgi:DNA-binding transcriptional MerR regulator
LDLQKIIRELMKEKERIDAAIQTLERLQAEAPTLAGKSRRGRKGMGLAERAEVSQRMKRYWEQRRANRGKPSV